MDVQQDESESYGDILNLLKVGLSKYETDDNATLLRTMSRALKKIQHPQAKEETLSLV